MKTLLLLAFIFISLNVSAQTITPAPGPSGSSFDYGENGTDPSRPNQPANRIISNAVKQSKYKQTEKSPESSGDFLEGLRLSTMYGRTSFDDGDINSSGEVDEFGFFISGDLGESTTVTLGYTNIKYRYGRPSPAARIQAHGYEASIHYSLSDNYGIGAYGFYQDIDIEFSNPNTYSYGGGLLFTTYHDFGYFNLASSHTLTYVDYDTEEDTIYIGLVELSKDITDWFGVGINTSWSDSLTDNASNSDDNYWTAGGDLRFYWDAFTLSVGYEKTLKLSDYSDNTLTINLTYSF